MVKVSNTLQVLNSAVHSSKKMQRALVFAKRHSFSKAVNASGIGDRAEQQVKEIEARGVDTGALLCDRRGVGPSIRKS